MVYTAEQLTHSLNELFELSEKKPKDCLAYEFELWKTHSADNGVIIYGAGDMGRVVYAFFQNMGVSVLAFCDTDKSKWKDGEISILSPEQASLRFKNALCVVAINIPQKSNTYFEIAKRMASAGIKHIVHWDFLRRYQGLTGFNLTENFNIHSARDVLRNRDQVIAAAYLLSDDYSRELFYKIIRQRFVSDMPVDGWVTVPGVYFHDDIFRLTADDIIIDGGACDGDTLKAFLDRGGIFKEWHCFEPFDYNCDAIRTFINTKPEIKNKVFIHKTVLGNSNEDVRFFILNDNIGGGGVIDSHYKLNSTADGHEVSVSSVRLDDKFELCTFIKMDIEGSEMDALLGAEKVIRDNKPILAVSVYHKSTDIWEIPLWIDKIMPDSFFYLRCNQPVYDSVIYAIPKERINAR